MAKDKLTKRELSGPDTFQETVSSYLDWAHDHPREVALGGAGLLVVILVIGLVASGVESKPDARGGAELGSALKLIEHTVVEKPSADEKDTFPTEQAKQEAIAKALGEVREKHAGSPAATLAALSLGDARYKLGKFDEALAAYDEFLGKAPAADPLRFLALEGRALALEGKGDLPGALAAFEKLGADAAAHADRALYGKARILEKQQKFDEARKAYEELKSKHAESPMARFGSERLGALDLAHPAKPGAAAADAKDAG